MAKAVSLRDFFVTLFFVALGMQIPVPSLEDHAALAHFAGLLGLSLAASAFVIVDGVGIEVPGHPIADFFALTPRQIAELSYHDPDRYGIDPSKLAPEVLQAMVGNRATLGLYAGTAMSDPTLAERLAAVNKPTLVLWGDSDRIAGVEYGKALARAIAGAEFQMLAQTGHMPQIESPEKLVDAIWSFAERVDQPQDSAG
jgi:pimeloyl-ACP methyl ester carboxylesterase